MTDYRLSEHETVRVIEAGPECLHVEVEYAPGGRPPPLHWHPRQTERFRVVTGTLQAVVGGETRVLHTGDELVIKPGVPHRMWNPGIESTRAEWRTEPGGRTEEWFATIERLSPMSAKRDLLGLIAALAEFRDVFRLGAHPTWLLDAVIRIAGPIASRLVAGRRAPR